jgi:pimeloyl-ACP methyl ester carboxylesterase
MGDLFSADLRPQLPQLTAPVLELAPVPTTPAPYEGLQASTATMAARQAGYKQFYTALFPAMPNLTVTTIPNSRHFIMVDQPQALYDAIAAFIDKLPK